MIDRQMDGRMDREMSWTDMVLLYAIYMYNTTLTWNHTPFIIPLDRLASLCRALALNIQVKPTREDRFLLKV